ncbi:hypothetical protein IRJ41_007107 [Triplophysa rosa]|uniref:Uncharacterized protein n=1 Tax=Triplophysa rosa TaxID=992332 RepID=A0A9W7WDC5_TRIRA|nr:hypothetical protein IRJ41_007107 [Triplophysa rosa]
MTSLLMERHRSTLEKLVKTSGTPAQKHPRLETSIQNTTCVRDDVSHLLEKNSLMFSIQNDNVTRRLLASGTSESELCVRSYVGAHAPKSCRLFWCLQRGIKVKTGSQSERDGERFRGELEDAAFVAKHGGQSKRLSGTPASLLSQIDQTQTAQQ